MSERNPDNGRLDLRPEWDDLPRDVQARIRTLILWSVTAGGLVGFCSAALIFGVK